MLDNYRVIYYNLPYKVNGFILYDSFEDYYTIVLNSKLSYECNIKTFWHELKHIAYDDFNKNINVSLLETIRH